MPDDERISRYMTPMNQKIYLQACQIAETAEKIQHFLERYGIFKDWQMKLLRLVIICKDAEIVLLQEVKYELENKSLADFLFANVVKEK